MKKVRVFTKFEVLWHILLGLVVAGLIFTGFEVHGTYRIVGMRVATLLHDVLTMLVMALGLIAIFWQLVTGNFKHYLPSGEKLNYYFGGASKGVKFPTERVELSTKLPLQRYVSMLFKLVLWGLMGITGTIYIGFVIFHEEMPRLFSRGTIATLHTIGAFMIVVLLILHIYAAFIAPRMSAVRAIFNGVEEIESKDNKRVTA